MNTSSFNFNVFLEESKQTLLKPATYFTSMKTGGGFADPVIKSIIYGALAGFFVFLWSVVHVTGMSGSYLAGTAGIMGFIMTIVGVLLGLLVGGVIMLILSTLTGGNSDYETNVRVTASVMILIPVSSFLSFFTGISHFLGVIVSLFVNLYGVYLIYLALTRTLKGKDSNARIISMVLAVLAVIIMISALSKRRIGKRYIRDFDSSFEQPAGDMSTRVTGPCFEMG
jgi:hypothetical protein